MAHYDISHLQPYDSESGILNIVIETPKNCRTKFKYDEKHGLFMFDKVLPIGQFFPFDFGFLPSTSGEDGDPLDAVVLSDEPTFTGCLMLGKLLGVIEAEQTQEGKTKRNDRFIAVPLEAKSRTPPIGSVDRLQPEEITKFFVVYNELQNRSFKVLKHAGPERAIELINQGTKKRLGAKKS